MKHVSIEHLEYDTALVLLEKSCPDLSWVEISIDFGADHSQSKILRDFIGRIFEKHKIVPPWRWRFILITDELINNAIEHGSTTGDVDTCIIKAGKDTENTFSITLEVHDTGNKEPSNKPETMDALRKMKKNESSKAVYMEKRGRGLFYITEKLVDRLEFAESPKGGLAVKIEKSIQNT